MSEELVPPTFIYLQDYGANEVTWCEDRIDESDIEYILSSEYHKQHAELIQVRKALRDLLLVVRVEQIGLQDWMPTPLPVDEAMLKAYAALKEEEE